MSVIKDVDNKVETIIEFLPDNYTENDFLCEFKEKYPKDYEKCMSKYLEEERKTKPGKTHPMQHPDKHIKNALKSYLSRKNKNQ